MKTRIYYCPDDPDLIFALAILLRSLNGVVTIVPSDFKHLLDSPPENDEDVYIFNIRPSTIPEIKSAIEFINQHENQIEAWFDKKNWNSGLVEMINKKREIVLLYEEPSPLNCLELIGYSIPKNWLHYANLMAHPTDWRKESLTNYYWRAFKVSTLYNREEADPKAEDLGIFFHEAAAELALNIPAPRVKKYAALYNLVVKNTKRAKARISASPTFHGLTRTPDKQVGYGDLGEIDLNIDLDEVVEEGKRRFPWLCVLQYAYDGHQYTSVFSAKMKIKKLLEIKHNTFEMPKENALRMLQAEIPHW